ncbi:hypothetical protein V6Z11_A10G222300 [Gossypium hirsutum]
MIGVSLACRSPLTKTSRTPWGNADLFSSKRVELIQLLIS